MSGYVEKTALLLEYLNGMCFIHLVLGKIVPIETEKKRYNQNKSVAGCRGSAKSIHVWSEDNNGRNGVATAGISRRNKNSFS